MRLISMCSCVNRTRERMLYLSVPYSNCNHPKCERIYTSQQMHPILAHLGSIFLCPCACYIFVPGLLETCCKTKEDVSIIATMPLGGGAFTGKYMYERPELRVSKSVFFHCCNI